MLRKIISFIIVIIISMSLHLFYYKTYAQEAISIDNVANGADNFLEAGTGATYNEEELKNASNFIFNFLIALALVIAVIVGMVIGIQFMISSVEEKAKIKETLVPYTVGCAVVFGSFSIWKLVVTILSNL